MFLGLSDSGALYIEGCAYLGSSTEGVEGWLLRKHSSVSVPSLMPSFSFLCLLTAHLTALSYKKARCFFILWGAVFS